ncbi:hypothetical protein [Massilia sp. Root335]|uniref:hypothetical protein n=1 Tax=Massilia sp. Root335 TaxID=1736517 RepID=UPI000A4E466E|nr:hypothetical protein [Massilia sp. Root335]
MSQWLVQLQGDPFDLEEFPRWFPKGNVHAITRNNETFLTGNAFNKFEKAADVRDSAAQILDEFSSVISLLWPSLKRPTIGHLIHENGDGEGKVHYVLVAESATIRSKFSAAKISINGVPQFDLDGPTQAEQLLEAARQDRCLQLVLAIWADPIRTWPRLYRLLEELEAFLESRVDVSGLTTKTERDRFTHSANSAEIAGKDARHRGGKFVPPKNPMGLNEATTFIGQLIVAVLKQAKTNR